jgi:hypothetical protein
MVMAQQPGPAKTGVTATRGELDARFPCALENVYRSFFMAEIRAPLSGTELVFPCIVLP